MPILPTLALEKEFPWIDYWEKDPSSLTYRFHCSVCNSWINISEVSVIAGEDNIAYKFLHHQATARGSHPMGQDA